MVHETNCATTLVAHPPITLYAYSQHTLPTLPCIIQITCASVLSRSI